MKTNIAIFDLDGTLIDISQRYFKIFFDFLINIKNVAYSFDDYIDDRKIGRRDWQILADRFGFDQKTIMEFQSYKRKSIEKMDYLLLDKINEYSIEFLEFLKTKKYRIELLTAREDYKNLIYQLDILGLLNFFDNVVMWPKEFYEKHMYLNLIENKFNKVFFFGDSIDDYNASCQVQCEFYCLKNSIMNQGFICGNILTFDFLMKNLSEFE